MSIKKCVICGKSLRKPYYIFSIGVKRSCNIGIKHRSVCYDCISSADNDIQRRLMYLKLAHDETSSAVAHIREAEEIFNKFENRFM